MKSLTAFFVFAFLHAARSEELAVFTCKATLHDIKRLVEPVNVSDGERDIFITIYERGKRVGTLDTGSRSFASIYEAGMGWFALRLLGGGPFYILKSKSGTYYGIFMEYGPIDGRFSGHLYHVAKFSALSSGAPLFVGELYNESSGTDPVILKQLSAITERVQTGTAPKATRSK